MRKSVRALTALIGILLMIPLMTLCVCAEEGIYDQNYNLSLEMRNLLEGQIGTYNTKDTSANKICASNTSSVIGTYQNELTILGRDTENLNTNAINLTYAKGQAAGRLTWIYYSHGEETEATRAVYEAQKAVIDGKEFGELTSFFEGEKPGVHACYTALLTEIYKVKYEAMKDAEDSSAVTLIINSAINNLTNHSSDGHLTYQDEDATNYKNHYDTILTKVTRQRNRDNASDQLKAIFSLLYPNANENFENPSNEHLIDFYGALSDKNEVNEINALFLGTVKGILEDQKDGRNKLTLYVDSMKSNAEATVGAANLASEIAQLYPLFATYPTESARAKLRDDWFDQYGKSLTDIFAFAGQNTALENLAEGAYLRVDTQLADAEQDGWDALYEEGVSALADVVADAEAQAYTTKHEAILNHPINAVAVADLPALDAAISDASGLSDLATVKLKDKLEKLGESYKVAIQKKIMETAKADSCEALRNQWITQVNQKVGALSVADLDALKEQTEAYIAKANTISEILDRYAEIRSADGYEGYKSDFKKAMEKTVSDAASDVLQAIPMNGLTLAGQLQKLKEDAILELDRQEGIARLYAAAQGSTLPEIAQMLTEAQNQINGETNRDAIPVLVSNTVKKIESCLAKEEMKNRTEALKAEIDAMPYLSQTEKDTYKAQADAAYASGVEGLNTGTAANALSGYNAAYAICKNTAVERNQILGLEQAQKAGMDRLDQAYADLLKNKEFYSQTSLDELKALYDQIRGQVGGYTNRNDLDALNAMIDEKIHAMKNVPYNRLYTDDKLLADSSYDMMHPTGYNPRVDGYIGSVEAASGLPSNATLKIQAVDSPDVIKLIREAAKMGKVRMFDGKGASQDLLSRLSTCRLGAALDISMGSAQMQDNLFAVSVLLADDVKVSDIIGVVYLCEDGSLEFYEITSEASLIRFTTTHFSNYYVVTDKVVNLIPVIAVLSCVLLCEVIVLIYLYCRRSREKQTGQETVAAMAVPMFLLTKYTPVGGFWIIGALSVGVLSLGGWITYMILSSRREEEIETVEEPLETVEEWEEPEQIEEPQEVPETPEEDLEEVYAAVGGSEEPAELAAGEETMALPEGQEAMALPEGEKREALGAAEERAALGAAEERAALGAAEERAALAGREEYPALDAPVILDVEEEGVIYEGSFTEADEDWIQDMVNEIHDGEEEETDAEAEIVDPIPEEVAEPEEEPVEEPEAVIAEEPVEEPEEVIAEEPIEEPVEQPAEELIEENLPEVDGDDPDSLLGALKGMFGVEEATAENDDAAPWEEDAHVSVRAEEVDSLMSDAEVREYQKTATVPTTRSAGTKKAQINLDTISAAYAEGDTVTLNSLKEKKLIGKNAGAVKILARGTLNKSLIVIAQDFSMAAVKMILLTGGQAIVTKPSGEQTER